MLSNITFDFYAGKKYIYGVRQICNISRRAFLATASAALAAPRFRRILLAPGSPLPLRTAASELARATGATVVEHAHPAIPSAGDILLVLAADLPRYPELQSGAGVSREWELVRPLGGGLVIAGSTPRNVCRAALGWLANPAGETGRLSTYRFDERFTMWDNSMNQMYRFSNGFDRARHIREIALLGHTGVEINRYADAGYHVRYRKFPLDSYAWYMSYAPALDAFVESALTQGIYKREELAANLADLREAAALARSYGLKPGFVCYEPRGVAEEIFDRYPELRGSRIDHPGRSLQPRYALDIANPRVIAHYAESISNLMKELPDLRYFVFWTQDSGSGMPFASRLYAGPNGSFVARAKTLEQITADWTGAMAEAGRRINPEFEVIMQIGHEYTEDERKRITRALPKGVTLSHPAGGSLLKAGTSRGIENFCAQDRELGVEPYAGLTISAGFDAAPIIGVPAPGLVKQKVADVVRLNVKRIFMVGGVFSPPQCPFDINQELFAELIRADIPDVDAFLLQTARRWCGGAAEPASLLVQAWKAADEAWAAWPKLSWYTAGPGQTQARWITRPLVPNIQLLAPRERAAWERALFTLPLDPGRWNIAFESGIRFFDDSTLEAAVKTFDTGMLPKLEAAVGLLDRAVNRASAPVLVDQRDRLLGMLLRSRTDRNLFEAQSAINNYLLKRGEPSVQRDRLRAAILADVQNTMDWIRLLSESRTIFFHIAAAEETPFLHKSPVEDLKLKLEVTRAHINDEPGPYFKELAEPKPKLQYSAVQ